MQVIKNMHLRLMSLFTFRKKYGPPMLILNTVAGLCNQMMDIETFVSFCVENDYGFSFRYCSFRNKNLRTFNPVEFESLFEASSFKRFRKYSAFSELDFRGCKILESWPLEIKTSDEVADFLRSVEGKYSHIFITQFWPLFNYKTSKIHGDIKIEPSLKIKEFFKQIKNTLPKKYNFLHYRYESDFVKHFKIDAKEIKNTKLSILHKKNIFNNDLPIYLSCSKPLIALKGISARDRKNIFYNDETRLSHFNFEESAYVDYLIGEGSEVVYGHSKSSYSVRLNSLKNSSNYYDLIK